jgi:hypothetical protein
MFQMFKWFYQLKTITYKDMDLKSCISIWAFSNDTKTIHFEPTFAF